MFERILVFAPHTDDGEFGCGGTIAKFCDEGREVYYVAFSAAETSVPPQYPSDILRKEVKQATKVLGVASDHLIVLNYTVRSFPLQRQDILEDMVRYKKEIKPDLILAPALNDIHQDHQVVAAEALRAFKTITILGYEIHWNNITFNTQSFIVLEESHIQRKLMAVQCYESQKDRDYANEDYLRSLARTRGVQIGEKYAEAFEVMRWVVRDKKMES